MSGAARRANGQEEPDETLMARYAAGDAEGFAELFRRYEPRAYAFFARRTGSPQRAEDLYQELFLRVHRARRDYDPSRPFAPWFFQIANHLLVDDRRRGWSREVSLADRDLRREDARSDDRAAHREQLDQLLRGLSPEERYVVLSAKVEGVAYRELAEHLGKSVDAVKKTASRAILRLRSVLPADSALGKR